MEKTEKETATKEVQVYSTRDLYLATTLITNGFEMCGVDYQIEGNASKVVGYFNFKRTDELLEAENPFDPSDIVFGCPACKSVDCFDFCCDEPGCWEPIICGINTDDGYRQTCSKHLPLTKENG